MNRNQKLFWMFAPLALGFVILIALVHDARNPAVAYDNCVVTATGTDVARFKPTSRELYRQSENVLNDVSLHCNRLGNLVLNDTQIFVTPIKSGQGADLSHKTYHILPERWLVSIHTGPESK